MAAPNSCPVTERVYPMQLKDYLIQYLRAGAWKIETLDASSETDVSIIVEMEGTSYGIAINGNRARGVNGTDVQNVVRSAKAQMCTHAAIVSVGEFLSSAQKQADSLDPPVALIDGSDIVRISRILEEHAQGKKKSSSKLIYGIVGVIVLVAGAVLFYFQNQPSRTVVVSTPSQPAAAVVTPDPGPVPDNTLSEYEKVLGWELLFNGVSTEGWTNDKREKVQLPAEDGTIVLTGFPDPYLFAWASYDDFEFNVDYKVDPGFDGGIILRTFPLVSLGTGLRDNGIEVSIADRYDGGDQAAGAIYDFVKPTENAAKPAGEWNNLRVICDGPSVKVILNDKTVSTMDLDQWGTPHTRPDGSRHRLSFPLSKRARKGYVGLPNPGVKAAFKNIKIRPTTASAESKF